MSRIWPGDSSHINAPYHQSRINKDGKHYFHEGIDIRAVQGGNIYAPESGTIERMYTDTTNTHAGGSFIELRDGEGKLHRFYHISKFNVKEKEKVQAGQVIAFAGGNPDSPGSGSHTTGSHIHWEIRSSSGVRPDINPAEWSGIVVDGKIEVPAEQQEFKKQVIEAQARQHQDEVAAPPKPQDSEDEAGFDPKLSLIENLGATSQSRIAIKNFKQTLDSLGTSDKIAKAISNSKNNNFRQLLNVINRNQAYNMGKRG